MDISITLWLWESALKSRVKNLESKNCPAILCKDIADHLRYLYVIAPDFFEAEKRFTLIMNLWEMLHILLLHFIEEVNHSNSRVRHVRMYLNRIWFHICIPLSVLKVFKIASTWICESPNYINFARIKFREKRDNK